MTETIPNYALSEDEMDDLVSVDPAGDGYKEYPSDAFVVSGPLAPHHKYKGPGDDFGVRCLTDRQFKSVEHAYIWAKSTYPVVYRDESRTDVGVWAFRVAPKRAPGSERPSDLLNEAGGVVQHKDAA